MLPVDLLACNLDQGQPGFPATVLPEFLTRMQDPHRSEDPAPDAIVKAAVTASAFGRAALFGSPSTSHASTNSGCKGML